MQMIDELSPDTPAHRESVTGYIANFGFLRLNWEGPQTGRKTVFVTGIGPSESGAIFANALDRLGVYVAHFPEGLTDRFRSLKGELSTTHGTWAAHTPFSVKSLKVATRAVTAPHFMLCCDDAGSLAAGIESTGKMSAADALATAARGCAELALFAAETRHPVMVLSLQKAREFADAYAEALALFCGVEANLSTRSAVASLLDSGARGLRAPIVRGTAQGALNQQQLDNFIRGWAKLPLSSQRLRVRAVQDGVECGEVEASELRVDLVRNNIGDGRHGFAIPVGEFLSEQSRRFEVFVMPENSLLGVVEMSITGGRPVAD
jgi:hypothetical protein